MQLECKHVSLGYNNKPIIKNVNFKIENHDYLCIIGDNGSGKSTLMKTILGLIKPLSGEITFKDFKRSDIGYVPQQTNIIRDFPASVFEIVLSGRLNSKHLQPFYTKKDKEIAINDLKLLNILSLKDKCFKELSGGQKQKVLLARALAASNKLLLLDEPTTALDYKSIHDFYKLIDKINQEKQIAIIMISHDIETAIEHANLILQLNKDNIIFKTTEEYIKTNHHCLYGEEYE